MGASDSAIEPESLPTAPALAARLRVFQPTRQPVELSGEWIETKWGKSGGRCRVIGALGQRHADVLDLMMYTRLDSERTQSGRLRLLIDPYALRRAMASGKRRARRSTKRGRDATPAYSYSQLIELVREIMAATFEYESADGARGGDAKIIEKREWSKISATDPLNPGRERRLWRITLSAEWAALLDEKGAWYDPRPVAHIHHGVAQAAARLLLTHDASKWPGAGLRIETVLDWLGVPAAGQQRRDARRRLAESAPDLAPIGLIIENGYVRAGVAQTPGGVGKRG
ncbi:MAG: hypothetical protein ACYDHY_17175 [Acidiferrobacterales bacterium]